MIILYSANFEVLINFCCFYFWVKYEDNKAPETFITCNLNKKESFVIFLFITALRFLPFFKFKNAQQDIRLDE